MKQRIKARILCNDLNTLLNQTAYAAFCYILYAAS
jgi:hypothetical protein